MFLDLIEAAELADPQVVLHHNIIQQVSSEKVKWGKIVGSKTELQAIFRTVTTAYFSTAWLQMELIITEGNPQPPCSTKRGRPFIHKQPGCGM